MGESPKAAEIEDVLSSIRRLVAGGAAEPGKEARTGAGQAGEVLEGDDATPETGSALVLTEDQRVSSRQDAGDSDTAASWQADAEDDASNAAHAFGDELVFNEADEHGQDDTVRADVGWEEGTAAGVEAEQTGAEYAGEGEPELAETPDEPETISEDALPSGDTSMESEAMAEPVQRRSPFLSEALQAAQRDKADLVADTSESTGAPTVREDAEARTPSRTPAGDDAQETGHQELKGFGFGVDRRAADEQPILRTRSDSEVQQDDSDDASKGPIIASEFSTPPHVPQSVSAASDPEPETEAEPEPDVEVENMASLARVAEPEGAALAVSESNSLAKAAVEKMQDTEIEEDDGADMLEEPSASDPVAAQRFESPAVPDAVPPTASEDSHDNLFGAPHSAMDEAALRALITDCVHRELQGALGERVSENIRKLVQREVARALEARDLS